MAFKDVKQNYSVYILNKQDITITDGKVISVGFPHLYLSTKPAMGQSQEESISRMESTVNNFINSFNHAQGNSNTAQ